MKVETPNWSWQDRFHSLSGELILSALGVTPDSPRLDTGSDSPVFEARFGQTVKIFLDKKVNLMLLDSFAKDSAKVAQILNHQTAMIRLGDRFYRGYWEVNPITFSGIVNWEGVPRVFLVSPLVDGPSLAELGKAEGQQVDVDSLCKHVTTQLRFDPALYGVHLTSPNVRLVDAPDRGTVFKIIKVWTQFSRYCS